MGMLYRRKKRDPATDKLVEKGPWWIKYYRDGRPFYESTETEDRKEARDILKKKEGEVAEGRHQGTRVNKTRLSDLFEIIKRHYVMNRKKSFRRLNDFIKHLSAHFGNIKASRIGTDQIEAYILKRQEQGAANGTINRELACLRRMFRLAKKQTPPKVATVPEIPMLEENNTRSGFFSHEEFLAVRGALPDYAQVAVSIAYYAGLRIGEILGLEWSQVDLVEGKLSLTPLQTKTKTARTVYLPPDLLRVLLEARRRRDVTYPDCPWVCHRKGKRLERIRKTWLAACRRVGLEGKLIHDFRRTAVRNMVRAGIQEKVAMNMSGHKTRSVFDRYNIVNEEDLKGAAKALTAYLEREKVTLSVTLAELEGQPSPLAPFKVPEKQEEEVVPPTRVERATRGLGRLIGVTTLGSGSPHHATKSIGWARCLIAWHCLLCSHVACPNRDQNRDSSPGTVTETVTGVGARSSTVPFRLP